MSPRQRAAVASSVGSMDSMRSFSSVMSRGVANVVIIEKKRTTWSPLRNTDVSSGRGAELSLQLCHSSGTSGYPSASSSSALALPSSGEAIDTHFAPLVHSAERKALVHVYAIALERNPLAGVEPVLRRSTGPVRIVWGSADSIFSAASPDYLDRIFGNSCGVRRLIGRKLFWPEELPEARTLWG